MITAEERETMSEQEELIRKIQVLALEN